MKKYVVRRILQMLFTYFVFLTLLFFLFRIMPGDPTTLYLVEGMTPDARADMLRRLGLDKPLHEQYIDYIAQLLTGDLGQSIRYRRPVAGLIVDRFWNSIVLMGTAVTLAYFFGIIIGAIMGWYRGHRPEKVGMVVSLLARSSPEFWTGTVLLIVFGFWLGWFPVSGMGGVGEQAANLYEEFFNLEFLHHLVLPVLTGALYYLSLPALVMRSTLIEKLHADFIEVKEAEGLSTYRILFHHAVRNSMLPVVTLAALSISFAVGGSLVIETVFSWPGMGREMVQAIHSKDYPVATAAFFFLGSIIIFMNLVADLMYAFLDPRVRYS